MPTVELREIMDLGSIVRRTAIAIGAFFIESVMVYFAIRVIAFEF